MNGTLTQVQTFTTHTGVNLYSFASDFLVVIILFSFFFLLARYIGRGPFVALIISLYTGYASYTVFPFIRFLPSSINVAPFANMALFGIFVAITYIILRRIVVSDFLSIGTIGLAILSFLAAGFLIALAYHTFPVQRVYTFTPAINALFAAKAYFFWWFVAPLTGLFFFAR